MDFFLNFSHFFFRPSDPPPYISTLAAWPALCLPQDHTEGVGGWDALDVEEIISQLQSLTHHFGLILGW